jgi:hypothetical protein
MKIAQSDRTQCVKERGDSLRSNDGNFRDWDEENMRKFVDD